MGFLFCPSSSRDKNVRQKENSGWEWRWEGKGPECVSEDLISSSLDEPRGEKRPLHGLCAISQVTWPHCRLSELLKMAAPTDSAGSKAYTVFQR